MKRWKSQPERGLDEWAALELLTEGRPDADVAPRFVGGDLVLRMKTLPADTVIDRMNEEFADVIVSGGIEPATASKAEIADNDVPDLARLKFRFDRHGYARLRTLIDRVNGK